MAEPEEESEKKSGQGKYEIMLEMRHTTKFSGDHKKEKSLLSEIKIAEIEEPAVENVTKTSDNLEMAELTPDPVPDSDQEDININGEK